MSSETIVTAIFLISAVIAAGVLVNAIFPVFYKTTDTIVSSTHNADERLRTDFKIVNSYASGQDAKVWLKNIGTSRIASADLDGSDMFIGGIGDFERVSYTDGVVVLKTWTFEILDNSNSYWDPRETVELTIKSDKIPASGEITDFQFVLSNGKIRSVEFTAS